MKKTVGFIGLGIMGRPMAINLVKAGYALTVYDVDAAAVGEVVAEGARQAASSSEVARHADITITMVPDSPDVEKVIFGADGVLEGVPSGGIVVDMSTISPKVTCELAAALSEKGAEMLDAPVSGGQQGAIDGTLSIMAGGKQEVFNKCLPLFEVMGGNVVLMGGNGAGQTTKLCNQVICGLTILAAAEGVMLARHSGVDLDKMLRIVTKGLAGSNILSQLGPKMVAGDLAPGFMVDLQQKDLRLALNAAEELTTPLPGTALVKQLFCVAQADGRGREGTQTMITVLEKLSGQNHCA